MEVEGEENEKEKNVKPIKNSSLSLFSISNLTHAVWRYKSANRGAFLVMLSSRRRRRSAVAPRRQGRRRHGWMDFLVDYPLFCLSLSFARSSCRSFRES